MGNWENNIRKVVPYTPGEQPNQTDMIKLNTNENPYPPAPGVTEVLSNTDTDALRLYPDPAAKRSCACHCRGVWASGRSGICRRGI